MAERTQNATTLTEECQVSIPLKAIGLLKLSVGPSRHSPWQPASPSRKPTDLTLSQLHTKEVKLLASEPDSQASHFEIFSSRRKHAFSLGSNGTSAMLEPFPRSCKNPSMQSPRRSQSSLSINRAFSSPIRVDSKDSGFYSTKDTQDEEGMGTTDDQTPPSQPAESTPRIIPQQPQVAVPSANDVSSPVDHSSELYSMQSGEINGSEIDAEIQARQMRARERLMILRGRLLRTRRIVKANRDDVRRLREDVADAVDTLTRRLNELMAFGELKDIGTYYETLRAAQDKLGPAEEACNRWEMQMDEEEEDLEQEEDFFYRHHALVLEISEGKLDEQLSPRAPASRLSENEPEDLHLQDDTVQDYLDKVAEAERLKEDLDDLDSELLRFAGENEFRKQYAIPISAESTAFLAEYPKLHSETLEKLHNTEDQIFELRHQCISEGLFGPKDHVYEHRDAFREDILDAVYEAEDRSPLKFAAHQMKYNRKPDFGSKRDYVNNWLWTLLEDSPVNMLMLRTAIHMSYPRHLLEGEKIEHLDWAELVLRFWNKDEMGVLTDENYNASRLDVIAGSTRRSTDSLRSLKVDFGDEGPEEVIMGSESASYATQRGGIDITPTKRRISV